MAFMMPVVKNNYEIYPAKSRPRKGSGASCCSSTRGSRPGSRTVSESEKSNVDVVSTSPPPAAIIYSCSAPSASTVMTSSATSSRPQRTVRFSRSMSQDSGASRKSSSASCRSVSSTTSVTSRGSLGSSTIVEASSPKPVSTLGKFHSRLVDKLKRKLKIKDDDDNNEDNASAIRSST